MILWILIIATIALFVSFVTMHSSWIRTVLVIITGALTLGSIWAIYANDQNHLGMHQVTTTSNQVIYSASPNKQLPLLMHQDIGTNGKHNVYIYKDSDDKGAKAKHTKADYRIHNRVVKTSDNVAQMKVTKHEWVYKTNFDSLMFNGLNDHHIIKQTNTFKMPDGWYDLTPAQVKQLGKEMKAAQKQAAAQKQQLQAAIQQQVMAARAKNPQMTPQQQQQLIKQLTVKYQKAAIDKAVKSVQNK